MLTVHCIFCKGLLGLFTLYSQDTLSRFIHLGMDSITSISDLSINQIHKIQITMRYFFDRDGNYAGSSMQGWEILLLLLFPVALIIFLVFLPFYVFHKYSSREEDKKYEEEHPEILKVDSYITCWYPWHRYSVAYTLALISSFRQLPNDFEILIPLNVKRQMNRTIVLDRTNFSPLTS